MKLFSPIYKLPAVLVVLFLFAGCKQPETVVVEQSPTAVAPADTVDEQTGPKKAGFRQLLIGEYQHIRTLDPLFADNAASMRAVQLVYEGLVRLNAGGDVISGVARDWKVSNDSLTYTFKLRNDIYYHDSNIFSTGTGRKLKAGDVKYVFERMAKSGVPPLAAQLFMDIKGFNSYYQEQHRVYNPEERNLDGITGISAPDEQTVVFNLEKRDPDFLKKLATPLAVLYPREAVGATVRAFTPVGTGPFTYSKRTADSTLVFSKFQNYYGDSEINMNRVDIKIEPSENRLFRAMSTGELFLLPQLGPELMQSILDNKGELLNSYSERYRLNKPGGAVEYVLHHNADGALSTAGARSISSLLAADSTTFFSSIPASVVNTSFVDTSGQKVIPSALNSRIYSVYYEDPFIRSFLGSLSNDLNSYDTTLQMLKIRAPSRHTGLFFSRNFPLIPDSQWRDHQRIYSFTIQQLVLQRSEIKGLQFNRYPWWIDLRGVTLPASENMN